MSCTRANGMKRKAASGGGIVLLSAACLLLGACRAAMPHAPTTQPAVPTDGNAALMGYIGEQAYVTAEPAYRAIHILWRGDFFEGDFEALSAALREGGVIAPGWRHAADTFLDRAAVGYMVCRACSIKSGLNWRLTGLGRYAWRELQYRHIAGPHSELGLMSGGEFLGVLARAEDYSFRSAGPVAAEQAELGAQP
ncbi:MAG: hypothetical protein KKB50_12750 [Planctomycetes bacterium]|nr:hypothetical protein [Planctomycetota bacterium]